MLDAARACGYSIVPVERWVDDGRPTDGRLLILRHDVDQHPGSALRMAAIEREVGLESTWYFRWRTAEPRVISRLRRVGASVGFHYETLTRMARARGLLTQDDAESLVPEARALLRREIAAFADRHGRIRSACPHGDSRVPGITNAVLLQGEEWASYGLEFDGNEIMRGTRLGSWLTDRSSPDGGWSDQADPHALFADGVSPVLCLTHPNNWVSGAALWGDRALSALLPSSLPGPIRTRSDEPAGT